MCVCVCVFQSRTLVVPINDTAVKSGWQSSPRIVMKKAPAVTVRVAMASSLTMLLILEERDEPREKMVATRPIIVRAMKSATPQLIPVTTKTRRLERKRPWICLR